MLAFYLAVVKRRVIVDIGKVGKAIAYLRKRAGYTQKELADRIGISDKAVSKWERGQGLPEIGYLRKLSILLDTDSDSLLACDVAHHDSGWYGIIVLDENGYDIGAGTVIYDKPLINFLLSYFLLVGIKNIMIICTDADRKYINRSLGDGSDYGIKIVCYAKTLKGAIEDERITASNIMMVFGRCLLYGVDQTRFFQKAMINKNHFTMLVLPKKIDQYSRIMMDADKKIVNDDSTGLHTQYDFSDIPIIFFPAKLLYELIGSSSISSFVDKYVSQNEVYVEMLDRGFVEIEVDSWDNVQEASVFFKIVQDKCGMNVYCIEEVAWRRGMISLNQLKKLGKRYSGTSYGDYVLSLYDRFKERLE